MALVLADRVKETTTTIGTASYVLLGAAAGFQSFSSGVGNGNACEYCCTDGTNWEVGQGTLTGGTTLSRSVIYASSNGGAAVNWGVGTRDIFATVSAEGAATSRWTLTDGIAAAGSTQGTATQLTDTINSVGTVAAGTGVILPPAKVGGFISVANHGLNPLNVYPATGETVEALAANTPLVLNPGQLYRAACSTAGAWVGVDMNNWDDETNSVVMNIATNPPVPTGDYLNFYARKICGRVIPKWMPPSGVDNPVQSALYGNNIVLYMPNTGTTVGLSLGTPWAAGGTVSHPTPSSTAPAMFNQLKRTRCANVVTTTNQTLGISSIVTGAHQFWRGNAAGLGGFFFAARFAVALWPANTCRIFAGLHSGTTNILASDTIPAISACGFWHATTDNGTTINFMTKDGTTSSNVAITVPTIAAGNVYDAYMYMKPNDSTIYYRLDDVLTGTTLADGSKTTNLPATTTFMGPNVGMSNGTANVTATTVAVDVNRIYVESDH